MCLHPQGNAGYLKYQDTSTGSLIAEHRTRLGPCQTMAQNHHSGVISLGHSNGTVTMWTPNISTAQIQLLAHKGPVCAIAHDPSTMGSYFATAGLDGTMKVWDSRTWGVVNEWHLPRPASSLSYSQKGLLAAGWGNHATVCNIMCGSKFTWTALRLCSLLPSRFMPTPYVRHLALQARICRNYFHQQLRMMCNSVLLRTYLEWAMLVASQAL